MTGKFLTPSIPDRYWHVTVAVDGHIAKPEEHDGCVSLKVTTRGNFRPKQWFPCERHRPSCAPLATYHAVGLYEITAHIGKELKVTGYYKVTVVQPTDPPGPPYWEERIYSLPAELLRWPTRAKADAPPIHWIIAPTQETLPPEGYEEQEYFKVESAPLPQHPPTPAASSSTT
ncbi:MAG: hypothetical protein V4850_22295 [Myxococcota bacterium]